VDKIHLRIIDVFRNSLKFNVATLFSQIISFPKGIIIALFLSPADYGIISLIGLWGTYISLISPGFVTLAERESPVLLGENRETEANRIQNIAFSGEFIYSVLICIVAAISSFFMSSTVLKVGLLLLSTQYIFSQMSKMLACVLRVHHKFGVVAKMDLINSAVNFIVIILLVYWLRVYGILIANFISILSSFLFLKKYSDYKFSFTWDSQELKRMFKISVFFVLQGIAYWGYRLADKTIISTFLTMHAMGIYSFAMSFMLMALVLFTQFGTTRQPMLWRNTGTATTEQEAFGIGKRIIVYVLLAASICTAFLQIGFFIVVTYITNKYFDSIPVFNMLSLFLIAASINIVPSLILNSKRVNKQKISLVTYIVALTICFIADTIVVKLGYGIIGVAFVTVLTQFILSVGSYFLVRKHIFNGNKDLSQNILYVILPITIAVIFTILNNLLINQWRNPIGLSITSIASQIIIWTIVIKMFYKKHIPKDGILSFVFNFGKPVKNHA
jgi:O-antigen/teichoic acid export membrane protein